MGCKIVQSTFNFKKRFQFVFLYSTSFTVYIDILSSEELEKVFNGLKKNKCKNIELPISDGDVVSKDNSYYFVLDIDQQAICLPINNLNISLNDINEFDYKKIKNIHLEDLK